MEGGDEFQHVFLWKARLALRAANTCHVNYRNWNFMSWALVDQHLFFDLLSDLSQHQIFSNVSEPASFALPT